MYGLRKLASLLTLGAVLAMAAATTTWAARGHHGAGECGENMYWHNGHCVDARTKPGKDWTAGVYF